MSNAWWIGGRLAGAAVVAMAVAAPVEAWGPAAHREVTAAAVETLPKALRPFYKAHRFEMPSLALEEDESDAPLDEEALAPEESPERRFAIDRLDAFPFSALPRTEAALKAKRPAEAAAVGRLPWLISESYARLVEAFRSGDKARILAESDVLAGLVADVANPLALTDNADGQKTGQHGLWARFAVRLPEAMQKDLKLSPEAAVYLDDPAGYVFSMMLGSYIWLDNLLYQEDLVRRTAPGFTELYYENLVRRAGPRLRERLSQAAGDVGSYWYTAWTAAGRPELK